MHILFISWKDSQNPKRGGAEVLLHAIAKKLIYWGHQVTFITPRFPGAKKQAIIDGITIIRPAYFYPQTWFGYLSWLTYLISVWQTYRRLESAIDVVIDDVHGLPSWISLYAQKPVILFVHEVANRIWTTEFPWPISHFGLLCEKIYLRLFRQHHFIANSTTTATDLMKNGIAKVTICAPGVSKPPPLLPTKNKYPSFIYVGRLTKSKRIDEIIAAFFRYQQIYPHSNLHIIGTGDQETNLKKRAKNNPGIFFHSFVSEREKYRLLSKSWALLLTSIKEGFGLVILEAASTATPTLAYQSGGITDTISHRKNGLLTISHTPQALAKLMEEVTTNRKLRQNLSHNALRMSQRFTWEKTATQFFQAVKKAL